MSEESWEPLFDVVFEALKRDCVTVIADNEPRLLNYMIRTDPPQDNPQRMKETGEMVVTWFLPIIKGCLKATKKGIEEKLQEERIETEEPKAE
jgi:hypothetical protein